MPDDPTHQEQPNAATADTGDQATTDPAPTTATAPDAPPDTTTDSPPNTVTDTTGDTVTDAKAPTGDTATATPRGDAAAAPPSPAPDGRQRSPRPARARRGRTTRTADTRRQTTTPETPPATSETPAVAPRRVSVTAHDRVWAALRSHPGSTSAELSTAAGVARSTVAKLLTAWAADGSVTSTPGATGRAGRAPHRWTAAPSDLPPAPAPDPGGSAPADPHTDRDTKSSTGTRRRRVATTPTVTTPHGGAPGASRPRGGAAGTGTAPVNGAGRNRSGGPRLAAGALHGMVQDYLTEHPGDHGPTAVGRALARSSGAVANALESLVTAGWAVRTNNRPRRYRATDPTEPADSATTRG